MIFPRLVYKSASVHTLANDQESFDALTSEGWFATVPEAIECKKAPAPDPVVPAVSQDVADDAPPTRAELEQQGTELGLKFDGRTSDRKLSEMISAALAK